MDFEDHPVEAAEEDFVDARLVGGSKEKGGDGDEALIL